MVEKRNDSKNVIGITGRATEEGTGQSGRLEMLHVAPAECLEKTIPKRESPEMSDCLRAEVPAVGTQTLPCSLMAGLGCKSLPQIRVHPVSS